MMWEEDIRIIMCGLQSTEVLEFWWGYHTNLSIKASLPKLALRPYLAPPGLPVTTRIEASDFEETGAAPLIVLVRGAFCGSF